MNSVAVSVHAATSAQTSDERRIRQLLEACLKQDQEVVYLTAKVEALEKLDKQGRELIEALDSQIAHQSKTITALKAVNATGEKIEQVDEKTIKSYEASLKDAQAEIARWQAKAGFWRRVAGFGILTAAVIGAVVGYSLK